MSTVTGEVEGGVVGGDGEGNRLNQDNLIVYRSISLRSMGVCVRLFLKIIII